MRFPKPYALILLTAVVIHSALLLKPGISTHSVQYNFLWTLQFADAFQHGQLYPRWSATSFEGLGSPTFYFYPPLAFWITGQLAFLGIEPTLACAIAATMFGALSGIAMYAWLCERTPHALTAAVAYMLMPYHLFDIYVRGALAEYAAFIWLPLIMLAIDRLPSRRSILLLSLSYAGLILTHLPSALLSTLFLVLPYGLYRGGRSPKRLLSGALAGLLGVGLSAFFIIPALTLQSYISSHLLWSDYYRPEHWFAWNNLNLQYLVSYPALALALMLCGLSVKNFWGKITFVSAAASAGLLPFIWSIEALAQVQFPWRLLGQAEFAAVSALALHSGLRSGFLRLALLIGSVPIIWFSIQANDALRKSPDFKEVMRTRPDAPEYLPRDLPNTSVTELHRTPKLDAFKDLSRSSIIDVTSPGKVTFGRSNFPIWQVLHNGRVIAHTGPMISFHAATPGRYILERRTLVAEWVGWLFTLLAALVLELIVSLRSSFTWSRHSKAPIHTMNTQIGRSVKAHS